jgi:hypothetical protein
VIEDELGPQSVADDIRSQGAQRTPREFDVRVWVVIIIILAVLWIMLS